MLGENIKNARLKANISQRELGRRIGKTGQYISYLESGKKVNPSLDLLIDISNAVGCSLYELLETDGPFNKFEINDMKLLDNQIESANKINNLYIKLKEVLSELDIFLEANKGKSEFADVISLLEKHGKSSLDLILAYEDELKLSNLRIENLKSQLDLINNIINENN